MSKNSDIKIDGQMTLADFLDLPDNIGENFSAAEINKLIVKLLDEKKYAKEREAEEKRRRREEEKARKEAERRQQWENHVEEVTCMELPLDWTNVFDSDIRTRDVHTESIPDALIYCLANLGCVDIEYISSVTGKDYQTVIETLKGSIFQNPDTWDECFYKGWETSDEYLSGNLMRKWKSAKKASKKYNGYFDENIKAIEKVLPPTVATKDIYITLGSPWIPSDIIDDFIHHLFGESSVERYAYPGQELEEYKTKHDTITGTWEIPNKQRYDHSVRVSQVYGTSRMEAMQILENTLNMKSVAVTDEIKCIYTGSGKKRIINEEETVAVLEKQQNLIKEFQKWVWKDKGRKERLETIFENSFSCVRRRIFDGSFLEFPEMSKEVTLYPYQKDAIARIIFTPNTLLAHDVGAGKTFVMIAAGQELRRMGLSKKNMYVVPNNLVGQWRDIFLQLYPQAKVLCVEPKVFTPSKREEMLQRIRDEDFDGIIIAYSCFERIPLSNEFYKEELEEQKRQIEEIMLDKSKATNKLSRVLDDIKDMMDEFFTALDDIDETVYFDELNITRLFVDEAHNFKNVPIETNIKNVLGISKKGSKKCQDMMDKVRMVQRLNDGKGVVMATGTPIANSITDIYIMQQYLQSGELALVDLQSFDSWVGMFAEQKTEFEIDVDTNSYRMARRFSKFHNLPELTALLSQVADFHSASETKDIPIHNGYEDNLIGKIPEFETYLQDISDRADMVRNGMVNRAVDNMLKITTDGRKAALDMRLVDDTMKAYQPSKVDRCAENVAEIYYKTMNDKSTQLIFCDTSTPKATFNIYSDLKENLMARGIPDNQIAFIHDASTDNQRQELFKKMQQGEIRILLGSTFKLGLGVNVQDRLLAIHHIDVPWRPADMTQREGRILRQGNQNEQVYIYRYITEGSFDAYSWQLLETKQRFITELLSGSLTDRSGSDVDDTVLNYAEVKALAIGNPLVKQRVEAANELTRYQTLQKKVTDMCIAQEKELMELLGKITDVEKRIAHCEVDMKNYEKWKESQININPKDEKEVAKRRDFRERLYKELHNHILEKNEKKFDDYCGFEIWLPANMTKLKPFIWLVGEGKYYVELGNTETGNLIRIDNYLDSLDKHYGKLKEALLKYRSRKSDLEKDLKNKENYAEQIEFYKREVERLDDLLEVKE